MSNMSGLPMPDTYKDVLTLTNNYQGLGTGLTAVQDAAGNSSPMQIALQSVNFTRTDGNTFQLDGEALTASAVDIDNAANGNIPVINGVLSVGSVLITDALKCGIAEVFFADSPFSILSTNCIVGLGDAVPMGETFQVILRANDNAPFGSIVSIKDQSGSLSVTETITVSVFGGGNIDGSATVILNEPYQCVTFYNGQTQWYILSRN